MSSSRYDEVSHENDRWFGCHGTTEYLLDSNGNEREQANYCYVPSTWAENIVEQAEKDGLRLSYHTPYRLNIHRDEFCELAWQTIQTVNPNINLPEPAQPFSDCDEDIVRQIASLGIVTGYEDGTFQPTRELSRQERQLSCSAFIWCCMERSKPVLRSMPTTGVLAYGQRILSMR